MTGVLRAGWVAAAAAVLLLAIAPAARATIVPGPPVLGVNDYYVYDATGCDVSETSVLAVAHGLAASGLAAAGYEYVNIDDCWERATRTGGGFLTPGARFPHGMKWLGQRIHALGLRFGIYTSIGTATCHGLPGSLGHYVQDVGRFAYWGVDLVKADDCHAGTQAQQTADYQRFTADVKASPRQMVLSTALPVLEPVGSRAWGDAVHASVATGADSWLLPPNLTTRLPVQPQIMQHLHAAFLAEADAHPGHWNDLDIVSACAPAFSWGPAVTREELSIWAMAASPILIGCAPGTDQALFANPGMLAIDQSGAAGRLVASASGVVLAAKPGSVLIVNTTGVTRTVTFTPAQLGSPAHLTDVWSGTVIAVTGPVTWTTGPYAVELLATS